MVSDESIKRETYLVYVDEFGDPHSRWHRGDGYGYSSGSYFVGPSRGSYYWQSPRDILTDSALEVVGRMKILGPTTKGSWIVAVIQSTGPVHRGFMVKINGKGELFLRTRRGIQPRHSRVTNPRLVPSSTPPSSRATRTTHFSWS